jgi:tetratricopeptide (TPR) repeat protein
MLRIEKVLPLFLFLLFPFIIMANGGQFPHEEPFMNALQERDRAFKLDPDFHQVLIRKGFVPTLNFNRIRWKYEHEMRRRPDDPFLSFCLGELYRYKNRYEDAEQFYGAAIEKAGDHLFRHILLLELFSQRRLHQWQIQHEDFFLEMKKDYGALSIPFLSKYFFLRANEAAAMGLDAEVERNMQLARELDPYNLGTRFYYVQYLFYHHRFDFFDEFLSSVQMLFIDFISRLKLVIFAYNFLYILLLLISGILLVGYFIRYFSYAVAKITTLLPRKMAPSKRQVFSVVLLLLPLIWAVPSFFAFAYILLVPIPFLERKERWLSQIFLFFLAILSFLGGFQARSVTSLDPLERINLLDQIQKSRYEERWVRKCDSLLARSNRDFAAYYLKGLQQKRGGLFDQAEMSYRSGIAIEPRLHQTHNNLANVLFWKEEVDSAIKHYERALSFEPQSAAAHYNLAQAYVRKLQFEKSTQHMKHSSDLDFDLVRRQTQSSKERNNRFFIDCTLPEELLWIEFSELTEEASIFPWKYLGIHYRTVCILFIGFVVLYMIIPRMAKNPKQECPICLAPITKGNSQKLEKEDICWRCYARLHTIHSLDIQDRLREKIRIDTKIRFRYAAILWGLFIPGLGHLQAGRTRTGSLFAIAFSILCSLLLVSRITGIAFYPHSGNTPHYGLFIIAACIALLYLFSLLSLFAAGYEVRK